ncbi:hypothetical protein V1478_000246, partial [Vespula squamosa]
LLQNCSGKLLTAVQFSSTVTKLSVCAPFMICLDCVYVFADPFYFAYQRYRLICVASVYCFSRSSVVIFFWWYIYYKEEHALYYHDEQFLRWQHNNKLAHYLLPRPRRFMVSQSSFCQDGIVRRCRDYGLHFRESMILWERKKEN